MIPVRSLAEAAVYARATGVAVVDRAEPRPGVHAWRGWWRDEPRELVFAVRPSLGPSAVLDADAFAEVATALVRSAPPVTTLFPRGEARRVVEDLTLALYAFDEAARDPALADPAARDGAAHLRAGWIAALAVARDAVAAAPSGVGALQEVQRARLRATLLPGLPVAEALRRALGPGEAAPVVRRDGEVEVRALALRDPAPGHAALVLVARGGLVVGHRVVEGADGEALARPDTAAGPPPAP